MRKEDYIKLKENINTMMKNYKEIMANSSIKKELAERNQFHNIFRNTLGDMYLSTILFLIPVALFLGLSSITFYKLIPVIFGVSFFSNMGLRLVTDLQYGTKKNYKMISNATTEEEKKQDEFTAAVAYEKAKNRLEELKKTEDMINNMEKNTSENSYVKGKTTKEECQQNIEMYSKKLEKSLEELDTLSAQNVLSLDYVVKPGIFEVIGHATMQGLGINLLTVNPLFTIGLLPGIVSFLASIGASAIMGGVFMNESLIYEEAFKKVNQTLEHNAIPLDHDKAMQIYATIDEEKINKKIDEIVSCRQKIIENKELLRTIESMEEEKKSSEKDKQIDRQLDKLLESSYGFSEEDLSYTPGGVAYQKLRS